MKHSNEKKKTEILSSRGIRYCIPSKTHQLEIRQKKKYTTYFPSFETTESHLFYLILSIIFSITFLDKKTRKSFISFGVFLFLPLQYLSIPFSLSFFIISSQYKDVSLLFSFPDNTKISLLIFFFLSPGLKTTTGSTRIVYFSFPFSPILYDRSHVIIHVLSLSLPPHSLPYWKINNK